MPTSNKNTKADIQPTRVAVIIPCYNHGDYVEEAIKSVVDQDYQYKSIFISDEGSTDDSFAKILNLIKESKDIGDGIIFGRVNDVAIFLSKNPNPSGPSAARNRLIKQAWPINDAFSMLDADDYYLPGKISSSIDIINSDPEVIKLVYTDAVIFHHNRNLWIREFREPYSRQRLEQECIISNTPLISKKALEKSGLYDESMRTAEDWDLWLRLTENGIAVHIPEPMHVYRVTGKNASDTVSKEIWNENWRKIQARINGQRH